MEQNIRIFSLRLLYEVCNYYKLFHYFGRISKYVVICNSVKFYCRPLEIVEETNILSANKCIDLSLEINSIYKSSHQQCNYCAV